MQKQAESDVKREIDSYLAEKKAAEALYKSERKNTEDIGRRVDKAKIEFDETIKNGAIQVEQSFKKGSDWQDSASDMRQEADDERISVFSLRKDYDAALEQEFEAGALLLDADLDYRAALMTQNQIKAAAKQSIKQFNIIAQAAYLDAKNYKNTARTMEDFDIFLEEQRAKLTDAFSAANDLMTLKIRNIKQTASRGHPGKFITILD